MTNWIGTAWLLVSWKSQVRQVLSSTDAWFWASFDRESLPPPSQHVTWRRVQRSKKQQSKVDGVLRISRHRPILPCPISDIYKFDSRPRRLATLVNYNFPDVSSQEDALKWEICLYPWSSFQSKWSCYKSQRHSNLLKMLQSKFFLPKSPIGNHHRCSFYHASILVIMMTFERYRSLSVNRYQTVWRDGDSWFFLRKSMCRKTGVHSTSLDLCNY